MIREEQNRNNEKISENHESLDISGQGSQEIDIR